MNSRGQSRSVGYLYTLVLVPRTFSLWGRVTHLVRGVVGPSGIRVKILLMGSWAQMYSMRIYTRQVLQGPFCKDNYSLHNNQMYITK